MAAKYQLITELYQRTGAAVSRNPQAWQNFLSSACRNYKCRFDEQLLIFAQRPDATAVTTLETWNKQFKRWVNKDSRGIAVFDTKGRRNTLKYYFDVSDTHEGYYNSRPVPIWQMNERYEQAVIERLSDRFGDLEGNDLDEALMQTAKNAVEDNLPDYLAQLKECTKDSFLEELAICKEHPLSQPTEIGSYSGFQLEVYYDTINSHYCLNLCGKCRHKVELGSDALGNLTRIENELSKLPVKLEAAKTRKEETVAQLENAKVEVEKPFAFEEELKEKTDRLNALNIELNLDEKDPSAIDTEPEQGDEPPERKNKNLER